MMKWVWVLLYAYLSTRFLYLAVTIHALFVVHIGLLIAFVVMGEAAVDEYGRKE